MMKTAAAAISVLLVAAPAAYAQTTGTGQSDAAVDAKALTDVRIHVIKGALQLTPEQEKLWPAVEQAIRSRAQARLERLDKIRDRVEQLQDQGPAALRNADPVALLNRRADALAQRSAGLKKLAEAWQPLYQTLSADQKQRARFVTLFMISRARNAVGRAMSQDDDSDD